MTFIFMDNPPLLRSFEILSFLLGMLLPKMFFPKLHFIIKSVAETVSPSISTLPFCIVIVLAECYYPVLITQMKTTFCSRQLVVALWLCSCSVLGYDVFNLGLISFKRTHFYKGMSFFLPFPPSHEPNCGPSG